MTVDTSDALRVVQNKNAESESYMRQLHVWLGIGSAGGAISMVSLAANLPDPAHALRFLQPSLWCFLLGVVAAGASLLFLARRADALALHHATAHNREQVNQAIKKIPEVVSSPQRMADEMNAERNALIARSGREHAHAESAWKSYDLWSRLWAGSLILSASAFVIGFALPLAQISFFGSSIAP